MQSFQLVQKIQQCSTLLHEKKKSGNINRRNYIGIREVILYKTIANIMLNVEHMIFSLKSGMITRVPIFFNLTQYNVQNFG